MTAPNSYKQYREQSVMTMTPGEQIVLLYDEALKAMKHAVFYMDEEKNDEKSDQLVRKAQRIIHYLDCILDFSYETASGLHLMYDYLIRMLVKSNIRKRSEVIIPLIPMVRELKESFVTAEKKMHMKQI